MSLFEPLLKLGPPWLIGLAVIALCLLAREGGVLLHKVFEKRSRTENESKDEGEGESQITGSIFGLLAFILAFTFSIALDRYDTRRALVTEEANAIGTTYLRASLLDEPAASQIRATLRDYARSRISPAGVSDAGLSSRLAQTRALRDRFWEETRTALVPYRETELASYFLDTANEMIDLGAKRELAGQAHVPSRILDVVLVYLLVSAVLLGYRMREKGVRRAGSTLLLVLFVVIIVLVLDLDQPRTGTILVPQRAMEELVASMEAPPAAPPAPSLQAPVR